MSDERGKYDQREGGGGSDVGDREKNLTLPSEGDIEGAGGRSVQMNT